MARTARGVPLWSEKAKVGVPSFPSMSAARTSSPLPKRPMLGDPNASTLRMQRISPEASSEDHFGSTVALHVKGSPGSSALVYEAQQVAALRIFLECGPRPAVPVYEG